METTSHLLAQIPTTSTPVPITSTTQTPETSTPVPITSTAPTLSGPTHGVYIAYQTAYVSAAQPYGFQALTATLYSDEIWSGWWGENQAPLVPNYCNDAVATANEFNSPRTNNPPYPTTTISGILLATTNPKPTCNWIPDQVTVGPGHLSCDQGPTSVSCEVASQSPTDCVAETAVITPLIQCVWQAED